MLSRYKRPLFCGILVGLVVIAVLLIMGDFKEVIRVFLKFDIRYLPLVLILAPLNYIFAISSGTIISVGRLAGGAEDEQAYFYERAGDDCIAGENWRAYPVLSSQGTYGGPVSTTSPIVMAERLTDGLAMVILASFGCLAFAHGG